MGQLTTHVLDTRDGHPAAAMAFSLSRLEGDRWLPLRQGRTNADGRVDGPLLAGAELLAGQYELLFEAGDYFRTQGVVLPEPAFLEQVVLRFGVADPAGHYHVPLLVSPWSYSTYRGS
ncbi:hydroxyisourate hydrolase [Chitinimonas sp.]|uniref:hydroxyisourate hydrolase n=1 Tax=Chitinimonas sp. TaxID=1934313 RepID=UPI002F934ABF